MGHASGLHGDPAEFRLCPVGNLRGNHPYGARGNLAGQEVHKDDKPLVTRAGEAQ